MELILELLCYVIIFLLLVFIFTIVLPLVVATIANKRLKDEAKYDFSKKLIEKNYPDATFFEDKKKEYESEKQKILSKELP